MANPWEILADADPEVYRYIQSELLRQREGIELIASENFCSPAVMLTMGSVLTNKYAEGTPGKRYYGGCEVVDALENLAISRAKNLFGCSHANVQPHSGAQANAAVYLALCKPGDAVLGMDLSHGGHLTHGSKVNFSGQLYSAHSYPISLDNERLDYNLIATMAREIHPKVIIAGASSYSRVIDFAKFREIADSVGAYLWVDMAHIAGLVAAGLHPSPFPHAHVVTTTTHKTLRGPRGGLILWNDESLLLNKAVFPGIQGGPLEHVIAAKAVCFAEASAPGFRDYQTKVIANAAQLAKSLVSCGFKIVSGGTDNHLLVIDLSAEVYNGKQLEEALGKVAITVNKNTVPNEKRSPFAPSGVRMGTPAVTSRGFGLPEMEKIAEWTARAAKSMADDSALKAIKSEVEALTQKFPLYPEWKA